MLSVVYILNNQFIETTVDTSRPKMVVNILTALATNILKIYKKKQYYYNTTDNTLVIKIEGSMLSK